MAALAGAQILKSMATEPSHDVAVVERGEAAHAGRLKAVFAHASQAVRSLPYISRSMRSATGLWQGEAWSTRRCRSNCEFRPGRAREPT